MDRQLPQPTGRHLWLLQDTHTGTATGSLLIYLGLLSLRGRGLLDKCDIFPMMCGTTVHYITVLVIVLLMPTLYIQIWRWMWKVQVTVNIKPRRVSVDCEYDRTDTYNSVNSVSCFCCSKCFTSQLIRTFFKYSVSGFVTAFWLLSNTTKQLCPLQYKSKITQNTPRLALT